jgi:8-oxo-dGTP pyrophosphatase MutT (NUDIX family)
MNISRYTAAGGVVVDGGRVLVLQRPSRDEVRLPKGHVEETESAYETALREVKEESGYADLEVLAYLGEQTIEFDYKGKHVVRDERYFLMRLCSTRRIERKKGELQFIPAWLGWDEALSAITYEAEREWVRRAWKRECDVKRIRYSAAGGVVVDGGHVLVLRRPSRDEVRLPKGHVEKDESADLAALREVSEESGYVDLEITADLGHQTIEFDYQGRHTIRDEQYFLMRLHSSRRAERDPADLRFVPDWLSWDEALSKITLEAEREWVRRAREAYHR